MPLPDEGLELNETEQNILKDFMNTHRCGQSNAIKFLLARKWNRDRASDLYLNYQKAIITNHLESVTINDVIDELKTQKIYVPGTRDRQGAALLIVRAEKHVPGKFSIESTLKLAFFLGDNVLLSSQETQNKGITLVIDMENMEWANFESAFLRGLVDFFQDSIPARIKTILIYRAPWWISMLISMITPFLKEKMKKRIKVLGEGELMPWIERDQLPIDLGGTFHYDHDLFIRQQIHSHAVRFSSKGKNDEFSPLAPPPHTIRLVDDEMSEKLNREREHVLEILDEKIKQNQEAIKAAESNRKSISSSNIGIINKLVQSRKSRLEMVDIGALNDEEEAMITQRGRPSSPSLGPVSYRQNDPYDDKEKLEELIAARIKADRENYQLKEQVNDQRREQIVI